MTATFATGKITALRALVSCHHKLTNSFTWDRCLKATHGGCSWVIRRISLCMETTPLKVYKVFQQKTMDTQLRICCFLWHMTGCVISAPCDLRSTFNLVCMHSKCSPRTTAYYTTEALGIVNPVQWVVAEMRVHGQVIILPAFIM